MAVAERRPTLGTFLGVYTPTVLTILGVIMYLRTGWLVGHLGLARTLIAVLLAHAITVVTTLSFSSVATNIRVGAAGAYFITSRSLGLAIGGAIGLPLFFSQVFSVTLYAFGLAEAAQLVVPGIPLQTTALLIIAVVAVLSYLGAAVALRTQVPILILIALSLLMLAVGALARGAVGAFPVWATSGEIDFWQGFAVFFPAVTGIMAGLGLSGDLEHPSRSIPVGALLAVGTGLIVYLGVPVMLGVTASPAQLRSDPLIWTRIAPLGALVVLPGLLGAIFSSAVGSMLGAPRTLQALARDRLLPRPLAGAGRGRAALLPGFVIATGIALAAATLGGLNAVAPIVTMFFLTIYGTINVVAAIETLSGDPSWRPRLRVPWPISLLGALACVGVMILIQPWIGLLAFLAEALLWALLSRYEHRVRWGDARRGLYESILRWLLIRIARRPMHARNWRPHVLVFVSDPEEHAALIHCGNWFSQQRGVVTVCHLIRGDLLEEALDLDGESRRMEAVLRRERLTVFPEITVVHELVEGIASVSQANGFGAMDSNTILLGWPRERGLRVEFLQIMRRLERVRRSLIIARVPSGPGLPAPRRTGEEPPRVHVWWGGLQRNGDLMLLLAYLLTRNEAWRGAQVEILSVASSELGRQQTEAYLDELMPRIRIRASRRVIMKPKEKSVTDLIHAESAAAQAVFFGLATPPRGEEEAYAERLAALAGDLETVFFVKNSSLFVGDLLTPDERAAAEAQERDDAAAGASALPDNTGPRGKS